MSDLGKLHKEAKKYKEMYPVGTRISRIILNKKE